MDNQQCNPQLGCWILSTCEEVVNLYFCFHESLLYLDGYTGFVFSLIPILIGIGMLGGLGGGMIKRPILNLLLNYPNAIANVVTNSVVFSSGLINATILFFEKHTDHPELPLINFEIAIIFNAAIPLAWSMGASISSSLPTLGIYIIQLMILIFAIPVLWRQTLGQKKLEADKRSQKVLIIAKIKTTEEISAELSLDKGLLDRYQQFYVYNHKRVQFKNLSFIFGSFILNQLIFFMRSTKNHKSIFGIEECTSTNGLMILVLILANALYTFLVYYNKRNEEYYKDLCHYRPEERFYKPKNRFFKFYLGGFLAGFFAGLAGIGAGIIMVTAQLSEGIIAREAAATSGFSYFMISLNGLVQVIEQEIITVDQELVFMAMAILGVILFTKPAYMLMNKYKVGYVVLVVDIFQEMFNIISIIFLTVIQSYLFGMGSLTKLKKIC